MPDNIFMSLECFKEIMMKEFGYSELDADLMIESFPNGEDL